VNAISLSQVAADEVDSVDDALSIGKGMLLIMSGS
jgi:hypothetical protein